MNNRRPALFLCINALLGAYAGFIWPNTTFYVGGLCFSVLIVLLPFTLARILAFLSLIFFCTAWSISLDVNNYQTTIKALPKQEARFHGVIKEATIKNDGRRLLRVESLIDNFSFLVNLEGAAAALHPQAGQSIEWKGVARPLPKALSQEYFDGERFGLVKNIHASLIVSESDAIMLGPPIETAYFARLREGFQKSMLSTVSPHETAMLLALLIGDTSLFAKSDKALFKSIGAEHLLAVSGLQISLLGWFCFSLFFPVIACLLPIRFFPYAKAVTALITTFCLFWFVALACFCESAVRALIMAVCLFLPSIILRKIDSFDALFASAFITILWSPTSALDYGFMLSYAAVFGILVAEKRSRSWRMKLEQKSLTQKIFLNALLYSVAAVLATLPIIAVAFRTIAPFAVISNAVLLPFVAIMQIPAMVLSALGCLLNAPLFIKTAAFFANLIEIGVHTVSQIFGASLSLPYFSPIALLLIAMSLNLFFCGALKKPRRPFYALSVLCLLWPIFELTKSHELKVTVIPVGQGDATLFSFDNAQHVLIDAGGAPYQKNDPGELYVLPTLKRLGINSLDVLIISHPDPDHILGAFAVIDAIKIKEIWHSGFKDGHPLTDKLVAIAEQRNIVIKTTKEIFGRHRFFDSELEVLAPAGQNYYPHLSSNDNSLVIRVTHGQHALLWPGDLERAGEHLLLKTKDALFATILKAPHHGSRTSSTDAFIDAVQPTDVIFTTGTNNRFSFPHEEIVKRYADRGIRMWNTALNGEIVILIDNGKIAIDSYQSSLKKKPESYHQENL